MSGLRRVLHPILIAAVVFAVLPFALPRFGSAGTLATEIAIYTLYAMGFNLLLGYTGLVSFGASAFFGTASYAAGLASVRRHGDPVFAAALHAELLHNTLQIEHLLRVACDELTDLVHDEHQRVARLTALQEFDDAVSQAAGRYVNLGPALRP